MKGLLSVLFVCFCVAGAAQRPSVQLTADRQSILIGEPFTVILSVKSAPNATPIFALPDSLPHFERLSLSKTDSVREGAVLELRQTGTYTSWDSGVWVFPALKIGNTTTKALRITVGHTPFNYAQDYNDIKEIEQEVQQPQSRWWWYVVLGVIILLLFLLFFPATPKNAAAPMVDAGIYKKTLERLTALENNNTAWQNPKLFYTELTDAFRTYLDKRKGLTSASQTTEELSKGLPALHLGQSTLMGIQENLSISDAVKFARYTATETEMKASYNALRQGITEIEEKSK